MSIELKHHHGGVSVPDLEASIRWYREVLGFEVENRFEIPKAHAKVAMIFAQTDPEKGHRGLACFLVETEKNEGFASQEIHHKMGLRGSDTASISPRIR